MGFAHASVEFSQCPSIGSTSMSMVDINHQIVQFDEFVYVWWMSGSLLFGRTDLVVWPGALPCIGLSSCAQHPARSSVRCMHVLPPGCIHQGYAVQSCLVLCLAAAFARAIRISLHAPGVLRVLPLSAAASDSVSSA